MVIIKENKLVIEITHPSPEELHQQLILDTIASMRWKCTSDSTYSNDEERQYSIMQFTEQLMQVKKD